MQMWIQIVQIIYKKTAYGILFIASIPKIGCCLSAKILLCVPSECLWEPNSGGRICGWRSSVVTWKRRLLNGCSYGSISGQVVVIT